MRILKDLDHDLEGMDVLLVEDIVDSGLTLKYLLKNLAARKPASLEVAPFARPGSRRCRSTSATWASTSAGLRRRLRPGLRGAYRNLPYIATLKPQAYGGYPDPRASTLER